MIYIVGTIALANVRKVAVMRMKKLYTMHQQQRDKHCHRDRFVSIAFFVKHAAKLWLNDLAMLQLYKIFATLHATRDRQSLTGSQ